MHVYMGLLKGDQGGEKYLTDRNWRIAEAKNW